MSCERPGAAPPLSERPFFRALDGTSIVNFPASVVTLGGGGSNVARKPLQAGFAAPLVHCYLAGEWVSGLKSS